MTVLIRSTYCVLSRKGRPVSPLSQPLVHLPSYFARSWHFVVHFVYHHAWNGVLVRFNQNKPEVCVVWVISVKGTVVPSILGKSKHPPWSWWHVKLATLPAIGSATVSSTKENLILSVHHSFSRRGILMINSKRNKQILRSSLALNKTCATNCHLHAKCERRQVQEGAPSKQGCPVDATFRMTRTQGSRTVSTHKSTHPNQAWLSSIE